MSETTCRWDGRERPRVLPGRHAGECVGDECRGCLACTEPHCRVCRVAHGTGTCAECMAETRESLREIARMCGALPEEVEHRGVAGEAMFLLGPAADPEARGHLEASVASGRVSPDYLADAIGETHPVWVLGTWQMVYVDALEHETDDNPVTIAEAVDYLDRQLTYAGSYEHVPFEDFARNLRRCLTHMLKVLHDEGKGDRANVGCFQCGGRLERRLRDRIKGGPKDDRGGFEDFWTCEKCRQKYTYAEYNFALRATLETVEESA